MISIPNLVWDKYKEVVDAMTSDWFGINCRLYYPAIKTICINCDFNPMTQRSNNTYKVGGPIEFDSGICPYCNGDGYTNEETSDIIKMRCYFNKKEWVKVNLPVQIKDGMVQTIGFMADAPKCLRASRMRVGIDNEKFLSTDYTLSGYPMPHGFKKNLYFVAFWEVS